MKFFLRLSDGNQLGFSFAAPLLKRLKSASFHADVVAINAE